MKKIDSISQLLVAFSAFLFICFYFCLSFYNRAASDDLAFIALAKDQSLFASVNEIYTTWSGRWTSWTYLFAVLSTSPFEQIHFFILVYYLFTFFILSYSITCLLHVLIKRTFSQSIEYKTAFIYGTLFTASFFYFTLNHIEAWWWLSASFYYLQGIVFLLFGAALLIMEKKNVFHYLLIVFSFTYVGACFEIYILIIFSLFLISGIYCMKRKAILNFKPYLKGAIIAFLSFCFSAIVCFSAPGNINRHKSVFQAERPRHEKIDLLQQKHVFALGISSLFLILGRSIRKSDAANTKKKNLKKLLLITAIPLVLSILITAVFQIFILKDFSIPLRGLTFSSFSMAIFCCFIFLSLGYCIEIKSIIFYSILKILLPLSTAVLFSVVLIKQYHYSSHYSKAYDQLISELIGEKNRNTTGTVYVNELPPSGMLTPLDIKDDYIKNPLSKILGLNFKIEIKK